MHKYHFYNWLIFLSFILLHLVLVSDVMAQKQLHSHAEIKESILSYINESTEGETSKDRKVTVAPIDNRLRLARCDQPLQISWAPGSKRTGNTTIGVRCLGTSPWKIYQSVHVAVFEKIWVAKAPILKDTVITTDKLATQVIDTSRLSGRFIRASEPLDGLRAKRDIQAGHMVSMTMLEKNMLVKRGDRVTIIVASNGLEVRAPATAQGAAASGDRLLVRNLKTNKEVEGILTSDFMVYVHM